MLKQFFARNRLSRHLRVKIWLFLDQRPAHIKFEGAKPLIGTFIDCNTTFDLLSVHIGPKLQPLGWTRKRKKVGSKKSQHSYISPPCGGAISQPICTNVGECLDLTDIFTAASFVRQYSLVFPGRKVQKSTSPLDSKRPILQFHALPRWLVMTMGIGTIVQNTKTVTNSTQQ